MTGSRRNTHTIAAIADSLMAFVLIVASTIWAHQRLMPLEGIARFLQFRLTLLNASFLIVFAVLWRQCFSALDLWRGHGGIRRAILLNTAGCAIMTAIVGLYLVVRQADGPVALILRNFFVASLSYEILRLIAGALLDAGRGREPENVIIVGSGRRASKAWRELRVEQHRRKRVLGFVDDGDVETMPPDIAERYLGRVDQLSAFLLHNVVDEVVIAAPLRSTYEMVQQAITLAETAGIRVVCLNDFFVLSHGKALRGRARLFTELLPKDEQHLLAHRFKRGIDLLGAALGLLFLAPFLLLIAGAVKATSPGPILVSEVRCGYRRRNFHMWKFRTTTHTESRPVTSSKSEHEDFDHLAAISDRGAQMTPVGHLLQRTSLDELPQLWNVLWGEMSLVGPTPVSPGAVAQFEELAMMRRFSVRPGMTGNRQVAARGPLSGEQWVSLEFDYIDEWSLGMDFKILARSVPAAWKRLGAA